MKGLHTNSEGEILYPILLECTDLDPTVFHLFFTSIFWRSSIATIDDFTSYKLSKAIEDLFRAELKKFHSVTTTDFQAKLNSNSLDNRLAPYAVFTAIDFSNNTQNIIWAEGTKEPFLLIADKFAFVLYESAASVAGIDPDYFNSDSNEKGKIVVLPTGCWEQNFIYKPLQILYNQYNNNNNELS